MRKFIDLSRLFIAQFEIEHFPSSPPSLYDPNRYFLKLGGKRIRPVLCLMGNELFDDISPDAFNAANAIELFHNFTLIHDDIMDEAPLRRGMQTLHEKWGKHTALLAGDVMLVTAYDYLNKISNAYLKQIIFLFNKTAKEVCEGQQLDMDFEKIDRVSFDDYLHMINLKTSVLLASCLQIGAIIGGAGQRNQHLLYEFGRKLGLAFQVQDDYLDAFGDPEKFGKQIGGDIKSGKKTFLLIHALEKASPDQASKLLDSVVKNDNDKIQATLKVYRQCGVEEWATKLKEKYIQEAFIHLDDIAVLSKRKDALRELALNLIERQY
jgi:geranylgeranyl diphosphate synthase type II